MTLLPPIDPSVFRLYLAAALVLVLIPGPDTLLVLSRSIRFGRAGGWLAAAGITTGNLTQTCLATAGITAMVASSPLLFTALRIAGGGYLAWLGVRSLLAARQAARGADAFHLPQVRATNRRRAYVHAAMTNLLNPKVVLFYLAFIPQFVSPASGSVAAQTFVLGVVLSAMGFVWLLLVAAIAAGTARRLLSVGWVRAALDAVAGVVFLGFAVRLLLTERRVA